MIIQLDKGWLYQGRGGGPEKGFYLEKKINLFSYPLGKMVEYYF